MTVSKMVDWKGYCRRGLNWYLEYNTPKIVRFRSVPIGILNRAIQWPIILYIIFYVLIYKAGYQEQDIGIPGSTSQVRGIATTKPPRHRRRIWDAQDVVIPAEENSAFFVTTNAVLTDNQTQGKCPEDFRVTEAHCQTDADCPVGHQYLLGHGITTGQCNKTIGTCMIEAWCPIQNETLAPTQDTVLQGTSNFTVQIKNHVFFPIYKITRSNIVDSKTKSYYHSCLYDPDTNPFCPNFRLGDIVKAALDKATARSTYDQMAVEGGVISIKITWRCNFDYDPNECKPTYDFDRLDKGEDSLVAKGYSFSYTNIYFQLSGTESRQLVTASGILFIITVDARAGRSSIVPFLLNVGSGVGLLKTATVICDFVAMFCCQKYGFKGMKYDDYTEDRKPRDDYVSLE